MNIAVGIACLVTVAVLVGVTGYPDQHLANEKQIQENEKLSLLQDDDLELLERGVLDNTACKIFNGKCQKIGDYCAGGMKQGPFWCRKPRRFGCCVPTTSTCDCTIDDKVYSHGAYAKDRCIPLKCNNGTWILYYDYAWDEDCGYCYTTAKTYIETYVTHNISDTTMYYYKITKHDGTYAFSQYGKSSHSQLGIDISLKFTDEHRNATCVTDVLYTEPGVTIELCYHAGYLTIIVNDKEYIFDRSYNTAIPIDATYGTVFMIFTKSYTYYSYGMYILGSRGLSVYVDFYGSIFNVFAIATPSMHNKLCGLCDVFPKIPHFPKNYTMSDGIATTNVQKFFKTWEFPFNTGRRTLTNKHHEHPSRDLAIQNTDRTIVKRSMITIKKACEAMNKGPCTVLSAKECQSLKEACVFKMREAGIPTKNVFAEK